MKLGGIEARKIVFYNQIWNLTIMVFNFML